MELVLEAELLSFECVLSADELDSFLRTFLSKDLSLLLSDSVSVSECMTGIPSSFFVLPRESLFLVRPFRCPGIEMPRRILTTEPLRISWIFFGTIVWAVVCRSFLCSVGCESLLLESCASIIIAARLWRPSLVDFLRRAKISSICITASVFTLTTSGAFSSLFDAKTSSRISGSSICSYDRDLKWKLWK